MTHVSWSGESCELLIQIQGPSPDWRFGVKYQFTLQDQRKLGRSHSSSRSRHLWSGMQRSQRMSFSSTITGWNSSQSMRRSAQKRSQAQSRSHLPLQNVKGHLAQSLNVSSSDSTTWPQVPCTTDQLLQQCSSCRPQAYLSVRPVKEDRDQHVQERQRQRPKIKRTERKRIKRVLVISESQRKVKRQRKDQIKRQRSMDYLVMGSKSAEC